MSITHSYLQIFCADNEYSSAAELWFSRPAEILKTLIHNDAEAHTIQTLSIYTVTYYLLTIITSGLTISLGTFLPSAVIGAGAGRLLALVVFNYDPTADYMVPGKYALIGAAAFLGGLKRMTVSATVLLMEATGVKPFIAIPMIFTQIIAKWVGDNIIEGLHETTIIQQGAPFLRGDRDPKVNPRIMTALQIMNSPVICFRVRERAGFVYQTLLSCKHHGFPIVEDVEDNVTSNGRLCGLILRYQMLVIFLNGYYEETMDSWKSEVSLDSFRALYPDYPGIEVSTFTCPILEYLLHYIFSELRTQSIL